MNEPRLDLLLVDSRHLLWRAASVFYDLHIEDADGNKREVGAIYGYLRVLLSSWYRFGGKVIACWDRPEGATERRKIYPAYKNKPKATTPKAEAAAQERQLMLQSMGEQEVTVKRLLRLLGIRQVSSPGWEADDAIATLATRFKDHDVGILSGDRDLLQLVTPTVRLIRPQNKGQFDVATPESVVKEFGVSAERILDFKALAGDASDNIPGAQGIGPKTAAKLLQEHKTWQQCLTWAANSTPTSISKKLVASREQVELSARLVQLNCHAPLEFIDPSKDGKQLFIEMAALKFNTLMQDGRREQLMEMGAG